MYILAFHLWDWGCFIILKILLKCILTIKFWFLHLEKKLYCSAIHIFFLFNLYISYIRAFTVDVYIHKLLAFLYIVLLVCERFSYISIFQVKCLSRMFTFWLILCLFYYWNTILLVARKLSFNLIYTIFFKQ